MSAEWDLAIVYLVISIENILVQCLALSRLLTWQQISIKSQRIDWVMLRTATCRVLAAIIYVAVGVLTLMGILVISPLGLVVFSFVQIMWQVNAFLDVRQRRAMSRTDAA